ncbi:MAG: hypothetical protein II920_09110 [Clostridia bacterium]|nr:hypothetical protein [Clostridia bacterium]
MKAKRTLGILLLVVALMFFAFGIVTLAGASSDLFDYGSSTEYASFGGDFYTYEFRATRNAANNILEQSATLNTTLRTIGGFLMFGFGGVTGAIGIYLIATAKNRGTLAELTVAEYLDLRKTVAEYLDLRKHHQYAIVTKSSEEFKEEEKRKLRQQKQEILAGLNGQSLSETFNINRSAQRTIKSKLSQLANDDPQREELEKKLEELIEEHRILTTD